MPLLLDGTRGLTYAATGVPSNARPNPNFRLARAGLPNAYDRYHAQFNVGYASPSGVRSLDVIAIVFA